MRLLQSLLLLFVAVAAVFATSDGSTNAVTWDQYSLMVNGERLFIFSGELSVSPTPPALFNVDADCCQPLRAPAKPSTLA